VKKIVEKALAGGAESCEVFFLSSLDTAVNFETSRLKGVSNTEERGVALRVTKSGRTGFATSTKIDDVDGLVGSALATAPLGDPAGFDFAGAASAADVGVFDDAVDALSVDEMIAASERAVRMVLDYEKKINISTEASRSVQEIGVYTSSGHEASFRRTVFEFSVYGRLVEGTNMLDAGDYYGGTAFELDPEGLAKRTIRDFERARTNVDVEGGPMSVVLTPRAVCDVMMTLHAGASAGLVDQGISPLVGKLGDTVFDERVSIFDDGIMPGGHDSAPFDDEGTPMQRTPVVESGVLRHFLTDLRTAKKLDLPRTGNGCRVKRLFLTKDLGKMPGPAITNWEMAAGEKPLDEIVSGLSSGVVVDSIMGILMGNLIAGDFSGNLAYALKIRNGETVGRVKDAMIAGNIYGLLKDHLVEISREVERVGLLGGIGSHRFPYLLLKDVSISAKA